MYRDDVGTVCFLCKKGLACKKHKQPIIQKKSTKFGPELIGEENDITLDRSKQTFQGVKYVKKKTSKKRKIKIKKLNRSRAFS